MPRHCPASAATARRSRRNAAAWRRGSPPAARTARTRSALIICMRRCSRARIAMPRRKSMLVWRSIPRPTMSIASIPIMPAHSKRSACCSRAPEGATKASPIWNDQSRSSARPAARRAWPLISRCKISAICCCHWNGMTRRNRCSWRPRAAFVTSKVTPVRSPHARWPLPASPLSPRDAGKKRSAGYRPRWRVAAPAAPRIATWGSASIPF